MQKVFKNREKIAKIIISCKTEEQLTSVWVWLGNLVDKNDLYDYCFYSSFYTCIKTTLLYRNRSSHIKLLK